MRIGLVGRGDVPERVQVAKNALAHLEGEAEVVASPALASALEIREVPVEEMDVDAIVTVGGDGSILYAVQRCSVPVCGINMGQMGFLTSAEPGQLGDALDRLLAGDYELEERMRLDCRLDGEALPSAVNEVVLKSPDPSNVLDIEVRVDGEGSMALRSDGVIVSTPTGSTAYSISAGGPFVHPKAACILVVPLADFNLASRPLVVPEDHTVEIRLSAGSDEGVFAIDGQHATSFGTGRTLTLERSDEPTYLVRYGRGFYDRLNELFLDR